MTDIKPAEFRSDVAVQLIAHAGTDTSFVRAARVSTGAATTLNDQRDAGLINHLIRNRHGSPFEHAVMTFHIEAPIFVFREFHRHRAGWSYNEASGRYKEAEGYFYIPTDDTYRTQVGKAADYTMMPVEKTVSAAGIALMRTEYHHAYETYQRLRAVGTARELARTVLPVGTYSSMYASCNPRALMHFLSLRTEFREGVSAFESKPQKEIAMVADKMEAVFREHFPITWQCWNDNGRIAP